MMVMMIQVVLPVALLVLGASVHVDSQAYLPVDCDHIYHHDNKSASGVYTIYPGGPTTPLHVYCDMDTDGGRWTVFLRRLDGTQQFFRPWASYKRGFGDVTGEYWLGLENIYLLILRKKNELRVDMEDFEGNQAYAVYSSFTIGPENDGYRLHLGSFMGTAGDSLTPHNSMKFTTYDKDQDTAEYNCAHYHLGGFWYFNCHNANPTGMYAPDGDIAHFASQIVWFDWKGWNGSVKKLAMKIRSTEKCQ